MNRCHRPGRVYTRTVKAVGKLSAWVFGIAIGTLAAAVVALALGSAYREGEIVTAIIPLALPPTVLFVVYSGSDKRSNFCFAAMALGGVLAALASFGGVEQSGVSLLSITIAALVVPLAVDLGFVDRGKPLRFDPAMARASAAAFGVALLPAAAWALSQAHAAILREDALLVKALAARITPRGNALVVEPLDTNLQERARARVSIRSGDRRYDLSDAEVESVFEERTVLKRT
ncbi:MAG: hypothetical protein QOD06_2714, partial [Candidatus Binatota bacterium]|nr:hypothetical protein [Candidatus Binatota bacterium]